MKGLLLLSSPKTELLALVLASVWAVSLERPALAQSPKTVMGVECARVAELGIDKQENLRAGLIMMGCGLAPLPGPTDVMLCPIQSGTSISSRTCISP